MLARIGTLESHQMFPLFVVCGGENFFFDIFINLTFYVSLYGSDNLLGVAFLCVHEAEGIDNDHCFTGEAMGECLYLFCL